MDLLRCSQATLEGMAEPAEPVDLSATAAMGDLAAMAQPARRESQQVPMAQPEATAAVEEQEELVESFQATTGTEATQAMAEPGDLVLRELTARPCFLMAAPAVSAELEGAVALVELQVVWEAWTGQMV